MKSRRLLNVPEDRLTLTGRRTRSLASLERSLTSLPIPKDLVVEIFSRLPAKSIARCRCLSKYWASVFRDQHFIEMFMKHSSLRPHILLACAHGPGFFIFSSHQPQDLDENLGSVTADLLTVVPNHAYVLNPPVNGLVCLKAQPPLSALVIYNPSTRESFTLPKIKTRNKKIMLTTYSFLGYDPIGRQFKVLSMTLPDYHHTSEYQCEYQVLTIGTERKSWRMIECCKPHIPLRIEVCIKGVLYYQAVVHKESSDSSRLVCFDVRSEKFNFMKVKETFNRAMSCSTTLINYNGKLGLLMTEESEEIVSGRSKSFELRVLEDAEKQEWSKHVYMLPLLWKNIVGEHTGLCFLGMIGTNKIVLTYRYPYIDRPSYLFYYNIERNSIISIEIQGMDVSSNGERCYIALNHVENIQLIQAF